MKTLIPFLVFCLIATCNAELRTWTAVNGKEVDAEFVSNEKGIVKLKLKSGKVFEVPANKLSKEDNEFITALAKTEGVNQDELEKREGIYYFKDSDTPYTGKVYGLNENGQKEFEANYKDGKPDGLRIGWHENGQQSWKANFKDGTLDGLYLRWHENGQKRYEGNFKDSEVISEKFWNSKGEPVGSLKEAKAE